MKIRRLSEIDLARLAALPVGPHLDQALRGYNAGGGAWSYDPVRSSTSDILGANTPLLGPLGEVSWDKICRQIERACSKGDVQTKSNVQVGKVLFDSAKRLNWTAASFPMGRMPLGIGESVRFWNDLVLGDDVGIFIPFFDHRREHGIANSDVRRIVFSMQNLWIRERHPDLANARLAVVRFPTDGKSRSIRIELGKEEELLSYDELDARVRSVYESWARISKEKVDQTRKTGTGGRNPFEF